MFNLQVSFPVEHALVPPSRLVRGFFTEFPPQWEQLEDHTEILNSLDGIFLQLAGISGN